MAGKTKAYKHKYVGIKAEVQKLKHKASAAQYYIPGYQEAGGICPEPPTML